MRPQWILDLEARRDATIARIAERVEAEQALARERIAALDWCRANGNPHLASPLSGDGGSE